MLHGYTNMCIHPWATWSICSTLQPTTCTEAFLVFYEGLHLAWQALALTMPFLFQSMMGKNENIATVTTVLLYQTTGATFHCALPPIAWQNGKVTDINLQRLCKLKLKTQPTCSLTSLTALCKGIICIYCILLRTVQHVLYRFVCDCES